MKIAKFPCQLLNSHQNFNHCYSTSFVIPSCDFSVKHLLSDSLKTILGWRCGSNGRMPASQMGSPEFKLQRCKRKEKKKTLTSTLKFSFLIKLNSFYKLVYL
jgi:hypothetical protein